MLFDTTMTAYFWVYQLELFSLLVYMWFYWMGVEWIDFNGCSIFIFYFVLGVHSYSCIQQWDVLTLDSKLFRIFWLLKLLQCSQKKEQEKLEKLAREVYLCYIFINYVYGLFLRFWVKRLHRIDLIRWSICYQSFGGSC